MAVGKRLSVQKSQLARVLVTRSQELIVFRVSWVSSPEFFVKPRQCSRRRKKLSFVWLTGTQKPFHLLAAAAVFFCKNSDLCSQRKWKTIVIKLPPSPHTSYARTRPSWWYPAKVLKSWVFPTDGPSLNWTLPSSACPAGLKHGLVALIAAALTWPELILLPVFIEMQRLSINCPVGHSGLAVLLVISIISCLDRYGA